MSQRRSPLDPHPKGRPCHRPLSLNRSAKTCWSSAKAFVEERQQTSEDNTEETKLARGTLKNLEIVEHARQAVLARGWTPGRGRRPCRLGKAFDLDNDSITVVVGLMPASARRLRHVGSSARRLRLQQEPFHERSARTGSSARRLRHVDAAIPLTSGCKEGVNSPLSHRAVATGGRRGSCKPERAFNPGTCVHCVFAGKDSEHLTESRKVQSRHYLKELCRRDTSRSQQNV